MAVARRGLGVTVVEPGGSRFGTSSANAGHLVPSHVVPFAAPGMVRAGLRSLVVRDGAFAVSPRVWPTITPWLWRFARSATTANVAAGVPVLQALLDLTVAEVARLGIIRPELDHSTDGILQVSSSQSGLGAALREAEGWARWGVRSEVLLGDALRAAEPAVRPDVLGGVHLLDDGRFDPARLLDAVIADGAEHGVVTVDGDVHRLEPTTAGVRVHSSVGVLRAGRVVVCAGVWTPALCRGLGVRLPITAARGDSITLSYGDDVPRPRRAMLLVDQHIALNPLADGLRLTAGYRLTNVRDRDVHAGRTRRIVRDAADAIALDADHPVERPWTGLRPATPDGLPCIGPLPAAPAVFVAAGHGMLGSTTGPGTGEMVAAMLTGTDLPSDPVPVSPARFGRVR
jgi:D-amino-acid dehydrogenase